jgi:hypothetical protein
LYIAAIKLNLKTESTRYPHLGNCCRNISRASVVGIRSFDDARCAAVQWQHRRADVAEARQGLKLEVALNANGFLYNIDEEPCWSALLDRTAAWANGGPRPLVKSAGGLNSVSTSAREVVKAGAAADMPLQEQMSYARFYSDVEQQRWLIDNERTVLLRLYRYIGNAALSPAEARVLLQEVAEARLLGVIHARASAAMLREAKAMGVDPKPRSAGGRAQLARLCADAGMASLPDGQFATHPQSPLAASAHGQ